ncbi:MAG: hypothetical protein JSS81_14090 [Acidobacteria bacterium]|nr:hypothetical protein [Acidobacteriota bacterium]
MKKILLALAFLFLQTGCRTPAVQDQPPAPADLSAQTTAADHIAASPNETPTPAPPDDDESYPGVTIDQKFPVIAEHNFTEEDFKEKTYSIEADEFQVTIKKFAPQTIDRKGKAIFGFTTLTPDDYHSNLIGVSHLRGAKSKEIYVVALGPGGVCCTNYWITDISNGTPRSIFRSEDFGRFRDPMEIFDADGDGVYELVQFDSAFRYFMDDCGSCSPEPRAVFKYDERAGQYLPAKNLQQDFVKENFAETGKWLIETNKKLESDKKQNKESDPGLWLDFHRTSLAYVVDLFYLGDERGAWKAFDKFIGDEKTRAAIEDRLRQSKFIQALKKSR